MVSELDPVHRAVIDELDRQRNASGPTPYLEFDDDDLTDVLIDGRIDMRAIVAVVLAAANSTSGTEAARVARLESAVKFYADPATYEGCPDDGGREIPNAVPMKPGGSGRCDCGAVARAALHPAQVDAPNRTLEAERYRMALEEIDELTFDEDRCLYVNNAAVADINDVARRALGLQSD